MQLPFKRISSLDILAQFAGLVITFDDYILHHHHTFPLIISTLCY